MFGMLRGVTEVVSGVTVTVEDHEITSLGVTQAWSLPPDDNLSSDWLLSPHLWLALAPGTRPLIGPLSLDLVTVSTPWTLGQNLKLIHFVGDAVYYYGFIFVVRGVPSFSV